MEPIIAQGPEKRGDILITAGSKKTIIDVLVTCPATPSMVRRHSSHLIPGATAARAGRKKNDQYLQDVPTGIKFVPFVIETGGCFAKTTSERLDGFWKDVTDPKTRKLRQASVRGICIEVQRQLIFSNTNVLSRFAQHLTATQPVRAAH